MPGLVPGIHDFLSVGDKDVDGRDKPGHDERKRPAPRAGPSFPDRNHCARRSLIELVCAAPLG